MHGPEELYSNSMSFYMPLAWCTWWMWLILHEVVTNVFLSIPPIGTSADGTILAELK